MLKEFGNTYYEIIKDGFDNITLDHEYVYSPKMTVSLAHVIMSFSRFVEEENPDMIVVHGDRLDALAGAIVGCFNNILVTHIEGGELSGTIDETIRHAVSKLSHIHLVANEEAKQRLVQLGEPEKQIFSIGSPDIDIMYSDKLPTMEKVCAHYNIKSTEIAIMLYHPVATEIESLLENINTVIDALKQSGDSFVIIAPNNDPGNEIIRKSYETLEGDERFRILPSLRFEYFLSLLKHAKYIIGNSSAGIREACVYGIPAIDIGSRQLNRYSTEIIKNTMHCEHKTEQILDCIRRRKEHLIPCSYYGNGNSAEKFYDVLLSDIWNMTTQKQFIDMEI
jgi:UDP-N-acetylglucosamine 2-epimerase (hydrolysing)